MRDPHDMIYFFKTEIQMTIQDEYDEVCQHIKMLKENHIFAKNAHHGASQLFMHIVGMLKSVIQDDSLSKDENEAFVEVLIYERIGLFLFRSLQNAYVDDEQQFKAKCLKFGEIVEQDFPYFQRQLGTGF